MDKSGKRRMNLWMKRDLPASEVTRAMRARAGFSLIEVMVATGVLLVLVLMVSAVFRQASSSWDSGYSRAEGGMVIRSVMGTIQRELSKAVDGRYILPSVFGDDPIKVDSKSVEFVMPVVDYASLPNNPDLNDYRNIDTYHLIKYTGGNGQMKRDWTPLKWDQNNAEWKKDSGGGSSDLFTSADSTRPGYAWKANFSFHKSDIEDRPNPADLGVDQANREIFWNIPVVTIRVELERGSTFSGIIARSFGRDGKTGTKDDIIAR